MSDDNHLSLLVNIDKKVDEVKDKIHGIEIIQSKIEGDLKYHIKRTDLLEEQVELINKNIEPFNLIRAIADNFLKIMPLLIGITVGIFTIIKYLKQ